jgi:ABC-2 type transport system permease protein
MAPVAEPNGVIHDIGYQRYDGPRLGRGYVVRSMYTHAVRAAFGFGRTAGAKVFPWIVVGIVIMVAAILTAVRSQIGEMPLGYAEFPEAMTILIVVFCAAVAPELVSRDLRSGVLPLYFSRPLRRSDYALAKLAATVSAIWLLLAAPQLLMFLGGAFGLDSMGAVWDEFVDFLPAVGYSGVFALVFGSLALLVASLAGRRAVAAALIVAAFLITTPIVGVLSVVGSEIGNVTLERLAPLASPITLVGGIGDWLFEPSGETGIGDFGPLYGAVGAAFVAACVLLLLLRYRKVAR